MSDNGSQRQSGAKLFIGRLPLTADEKTVKDITECFGEIDDIAIVKDKATGKSKGCAFVKFAQMSQAEMCRNSLHEKVPFDNSGAIQVRFANGEAERLGIPDSVLNSNQQESKLFVGGLPRQQDEEALRKLFSAYGDITFMKLFRNTDGNSKGAGFVSLATRDQAFAAIEALHHKHVIPPMERPIEVKFADANKGESSGRNQGHGGGYGQKGAGKGYNMQQYGGYQQSQYSGYQQSAPPPPPPAPPGMGDWAEYFTPEGRPYYHNARSNITQWDKPYEMASTGYSQSGSAQAHRYRPY